MQINDNSEILIAMEEGERVLFYDENRVQHLIENGRSGKYFHLTNEELCIFNDSKVWVRPLRNVTDDSHEIYP